MPLGSVSPPPPPPKKLIKRVWWWGWRSLMKTWPTIALNCLGQPPGPPASISGSSVL